MSKLFLSKSKPENNLMENYTSALNYIYIDLEVLNRLLNIFFFFFSNKFEIAAMRRNFDAPL